MGNVKGKAALWLDMLFNANELFHEYDPVKAREYYLRTRELKGREEGSGDPESVKRAAAAEVESNARADDVEYQRAKLQEALNAKLEELEARTEQLKVAIKRAKVAAMRKAGVSEETLGRMIAQEVKSPGSTKGGTEVEGDDKPAEDSTKGGSDSSDDKPKTAKQKKDAAKAAKEAYEEEKKNNPNPDEELAAIQDKIDAAFENIEKTQEKIEALQRIAKEEKPNS